MATTVLTGLWVESLLAPARGITDIGAVAAGVMDAASMDAEAGVDAASMGAALTVAEDGATTGAALRTLRVEVSMAEAAAFMAEVADSTVVAEEGSTAEAVDTVVVADTGNPGTIRSSPIR